MLPVRASFRRPWGVLSLSGFSLLILSLFAGEARGAVDERERAVRNDSHAQVGTVRLSWSSEQVVTDLPAWPGQPTPLYVRLEGLSDVQALSIDIRWSPSALDSGRYWLLPMDGDGQTCGTTSAVSPDTSFDGDASFHWTIAFPPGASRDCVAYRVDGEWCENLPASFCLAAVRVMDSRGVITTLDVIGGATIMGGQPEPCPLTVQSVTPDSIQASSQAELLVAGSDFHAGVEVDVAVGGTTIRATDVDVLSASRLLARVEVPRTVSGRASVSVKDGGEAVTLVDLLAIGGEESGYVAHHVIAWFAPGVAHLPAGVTRSSPVSASATFIPGSLGVTLEALGVQAIRYLTPSSAGLDPGAPPLFDPAQLDLFVLELADTNVIAVCAALSADSTSVRTAYPDWLLRFSGEVIPNDTYFSQQWWLRNTGQWLGTPGMDARVTRAWARSTGGADPETVVVIDSGCQIDHPDMAGRVTHGPVFSDELFLPPDDLNGHGTAVCGIVSACGNNGQGVAGVDWTVRILSLKVGYSSGLVPSSNLADAVAWARDHGYRFVNISAGDLHQGVGERLVYRNAYRAGMFLSCATGNHNSRYMDRPAGYAPYVTAVGAADFTGGRWKDDPNTPWEAYGIPDWPYCDRAETGSDYGPELTLLAPGGRLIQTTARLSSYWTINPYAGQGSDTSCAGLRQMGFSGTSASTPVVAGAAVLVASYAGSHLSGEDLRELLSRTTTELGAPGWDEETGWGRLNLEAAMDAVRPGVAILRGSAGAATEVSQQSGFTTRVEQWPGIPSGTYTAVRHVFRARADFAEPLAAGYLMWTRQVDSWGTGTLPSRIFYEALSATDPQWDPKIWIVEADETGMTLETHLYMLYNPTLGDYWWPADPADIRMAYTAVGVPVAALDARDPGTPAPLSLVCEPSVLIGPGWVRFALPERGEATLAVYDVAGRRIGTLADGMQEAGEHRVAVEQSRLGARARGAGVYFVRLDWNGQTRTARVAVLR